MVLVGTPKQRASCAVPGNEELLFEDFDDVQPAGKSESTNKALFAGLGGAEP